MECPEFADWQTTYDHVTGARSEHMTPVLRDIHWLPTDLTAGYIQNSHSNVHVPAQHASTLPPEILSAAVIAAAVSPYMYLKHGTVFSLLFTALLHCTILHHINVLNNNNNNNNTAKVPPESKSTFGLQRWRLHWPKQSTVNSSPSLLIPKANLTLALILYVTLTLT